MDLDIFF